MSLDSGAGSGDEGRPPTPSRALVRPGVSALNTGAKKQANDACGNTRRGQAGRKEWFSSSCINGKYFCLIGLFFFLIGICIFSLVS